MSARFVLSKALLMKQYEKISPLGRVSYSLKTNPEVGSLLEQITDCEFSVHAKEELSFVNDLSRVWFLADSWTVDDFLHLVDSGISKFVVYNVADLDVLERGLEQSDARIDLLLRGKLRENTIFTEKYFVFGLSSSELNSSVKRMRSNKKIRSLGLHFHRKTQNISEWDFRYEIENIVDQASLEMIDIVNIGGGFPVEYRNTGSDMIGAIAAKLNSLREFVGKYGISVMVEPGRYLSAPCVKLEAEIRSVVGNVLTLDCSVYNSSMDTLIYPLKLLVEGELAEGGVGYMIKGCTPCSLDIFRYNARLHEKKPGDLIVFLNAGAYNFHTDFCSLKKLPTVIID